MAQAQKGEERASVLGVGVMRGRAWKQGGEEACKEHLPTA